MTRQLNAAPAVDWALCVNVTRFAASNRCATSIRYVAGSSVSMNGLQSHADKAPYSRFALVGAYLRHVHLLKIAAVARCAGKSEMDVIRSAKVFGSEVAGKRASELSINPIVSMSECRRPRRRGLDANVRFRGYREKPRT